MTDPLTERVRELVEPLAQSLGLYLYDVDVVRGRKQIVRILAERRIKAHPKDGITVDECAELSSQAGRALELEEVFANPYVLEVSSPGLERALRSPQHFAEAVGDRVALVTAVPVDGRSHVEGTLVALEDHQVILDIGDRRVGVALPNVRRAHTVFVG
jgi:ribosome maturation factor RimP